MTQLKINNMLDSTGGNLMTLKTITLDERATAEIRLTDSLALNNEKHKEYPVQILDQDVKCYKLKISLDSN